MEPLDRLFCPGYGSNADEPEYWEKLPSWASFFGLVGARAIGQGSDDERLALAVSVPTATFCAAMIATGAVGERALTADQQSKAEKIKWLRGLEEDAPIIFLDKTDAQQVLPVVQRRGRFQGFKDIIDEEYLVVRTTDTRARDRTNMDRLLKRDLWFDIRPDPHPGRRLPPQEPEQTILIPGLDRRYQLASVLLDGSDVGPFYDVSSKECLVIASYGRHGAFKEEITEVEFGARSDISGRSVRGPLQEVLQMDLSPGNQAISKAELWSADRSREQISAMEDEPKLVIFDGASAYLSWRLHFLKSNMIVVLDRTDPQYQMGVMEAKQGYFQRIGSEVDLSFGIDCPSGVDMLKYWTQVQ